MKIEPSKNGANSHIVVPPSFDLNRPGEHRTYDPSMVELVPAERDGPTLERFRELRVGTTDRLDPAAARAILRELKAVGGNLRAVRRALTGCESGPELWAVLAGLPRDEALRRVDAAL